MKKALTIAGSDSSGGAGIQADIKTMSAHRVFGMSVITAVTAQNTQGVFAVQDIDKEIIIKQMDAIFTDIEVNAVKIGMVSKIETIEIIAEKLKEYKAKNVVVDPVMISKSGYNLLAPESKKALIEKLIPLADVITPNLPEAEEMIKTYKEEGKLKEDIEKILPIDNKEKMEKAAGIIMQMGPKNVLMKGGHLEGEAVDILYSKEKISYFSSQRIKTKNTHGTGCTLSSAIASNLALGYTLEESVKKAKDYIQIAIEHSLDIGKGVGPINHFYELYNQVEIDKESYQYTVN
ncbi:bifunctional hydroxymethylpyrimidine kinase/phosphomethylpyrimidine kinase [Clostridium tetani]|uniref:bifunctional hydroxymethylpyrimidine kinase/phosphomethylpyrimidine kinase n=1 Tax=Clostridium tetani TaxID=1513 RepID=UPI0005136B02|nr:bifunctional hydroxymethylpyrimidine kinase/phosphomethylpyrimidine kinase [Clostridium tetani]KGI44223.1 phosphomethylpyrimidine kinase [Clostridium tetani]RXI52139.1 bifunctional hydroxymethylpyrimidine kinase/phosphomethylpyrimidine kinase [Clostridium tetani]RXI53909.1 bifunctional hydroxymethylpyrimidine kinase/phosphomethylpyrimidine kinase [Clostridium tetani]RXM58235.1 bifunctional hydroxymethylpyrimidine kinase/phosphomethylpyrimidine kinase [Clostridium tetani]BDR87079.1 hydroxyme